MSVAPNSPAAKVGLVEGDIILSINGQVPTDVINYHILVEEPELTLEVERGGITFDFDIEKMAGEQLGIEISAAIFDQVRTCDNHCEFCFIYQLPPGLRKTLYMKDDDYRLSFLYGNFTTLTRFTEADLERVLTERLSPLFVSIHSTHPLLRTELLRNRRGGTSLRWLEYLLDGGIEVHGQVVVCPSINDGSHVEETLMTLLMRYDKLADVAVVPLGISKYSHEERMRVHSREEALAVVDAVDRVSALAMKLIGRPFAYASDEYYVLAEKEMPRLGTYLDFSQHENGIGITRAFESSFAGDEEYAFGVKSGFFSWVEGAPKEGYRAVRHFDGGEEVVISRIRSRKRPNKVAILTSTYGAKTLPPIVSPLFPEVDFVEVKNEYFGGNIAVAGLMVGEDITRSVAENPDYDLYLLPDVALSEDVFLDGVRLSDLTFPLRVVASDGLSLRKELEALYRSA